MSMRDDRLLLRGELEELKQRRLDLSLSLDAKLRAARAILARLPIAKLDEIDVPSCARHLAEAAVQHKEYAALGERIAALEQELAV
jgi:hypothetical protein